MDVLNQQRLDLYESKKTDKTATSTFWSTYGGAIVGVLASPFIGPAGILLGAAAGGLIGNGISHAVLDATCKS